MHTIARALILLILISTSYAREETFGGGNIRFLLQMYSLHSNKALIVGPGITDMPADFTFSTDSEKWPESISAKLLSHFGILVVPINNELAVVSYSQDGKYKNQIAAAQEAAKKGLPSLPDVILGGNLRFEYKLDGPISISRNFSAE